MITFGFTHSGGPEVFSQRVVPDPVPEPDQLLIATRVLVLNNRERLSRLQEGTGTYQVVGTDVAGEVLAVGSRLAGFEVGQRVVTHTTHGYANRVIGTSSDTVIVPATMNMTTAATMVTPGITAYRALNHFAHLQPGQTVIIKGASGAVGLLAVQLAKALDLTVIGVAASRNLALIEQAGVDRAVSYDQQPVAQVLAQAADVTFNFALNGIGGSDDVAMTKTNGQVVSVAHTAPALSRGVSFTHVQPTQAISDASALTALIAHFTHHKPVMPIAAIKQLRLQGIIEGHRLLDQPHTGRIVLLNSK